MYAPIVTLVRVTAALLLWALITTGHAHAGDASHKRGKLLYLRCAACHALDAGAPHKVGPTLYAVAGGPIAAQPGFTYSKALSAKSGVWTDEALDAFLQRPSYFAPGTIMAFAGLSSPEDRAAIIAYLKTHADKTPSHNSNNALSAKEDIGVPK